MKILGLLISLGTLFLSGCQGTKFQGGYQPPALPLKITVDTNGNISFDLEQEVEYPTPLGTFSVGVVVDPVAYFNKDNTLTVRIDCNDSFYDLHGKDFSIDFDSGYYKKINLTKQGNNILLEVRHIDKSGSHACVIPTNAPVNNSSSSNWFESLFISKVTITSTQLVKCIDILPASAMDGQNMKCIIFSVQNNSEYDAQLSPNSGDLGPLNLGIYPLRSDDRFPSPCGNIPGKYNPVTLSAGSEETYICQWIGTWLPGTKGVDKLYLQVHFVNQSQYEYERISSDVR